MSATPTAGHGLTNCQREVLSANPEWARILLALVTADDPRTDDPRTFTHRVDVDAGDVGPDRLRTWRSRDLLDRVGRTRVQRVGPQSGRESIVVYRVPGPVADAVRALVEHHRDRDGWCVDPDCGRHAIVNDGGDPRCSCGAPLREVTES